MDAIDSFAGAARVARVARALGYRSVALDRDYHKNPRVFDFNESAGFTLLVQTLLVKVCTGISLAHLWYPSYISF